MPRAIHAPKVVKPNGSPQEFTSLRYACTSCGMSHDTEYAAYACETSHIEGPLAAEEPKTARDTQVGGDHYAQFGIQPWDALSQWMTHDQFVGYLLGSAQSYLARFNAGSTGKGGAQDVAKAIHCCEKLLEVLDDRASGRND